MKRNLKLLYFVILGVLCLYVSTGPATAGDIRNVGVGVNEDQTTGTLNWLYGPTYSQPNGSEVDFDFDVTCTTGVEGVCSTEVDFSFIVDGPGSIAAGLNGSTDDPSAYGTAALSSSSEPWGVISVDDYLLSMPSFYVDAPDGTTSFTGDFTINLAEGQTLYVEAGSLDFNLGPEDEGVPEPGSAALLGAGVVFLGFLRRKIRA
jgi:hypothetical protein